MSRGRGSGGMLIWILLIVIFVFAIAFMPAMFGGFDNAENTTVYNATHNTTFEGPYNAVNEMVVGVDTWIVVLGMICGLVLVVVGLMTFTRIRL